MLNIIISLQLISPNELYLHANECENKDNVVPFTPESLGCKGHQVSTRPISQYVSDDVVSSGSDLSILEFDIASNRCVFTDPNSH